MQRIRFWKRTGWGFLALAASLAFSGQALPQEQAPVMAQAALDYQIQYYRLRNGLKVVLCPEPGLPLVSVVVAYGAGSAREKEGQAGLAYFLENLMFQGSENVGALQQLSYVQKIGGELNALTRFDKTIFYETLPSNQLALILWLESDRMRSLDLSLPAVERVRQEMLGEFDNRRTSEPYFSKLADFDLLLYPEFNYGHPWLSGKDIAGLTLSDIKDFHDDLYIPNNAVLCITGNFQAIKAKDLVAKYFETIPPGAVVPALPLPDFDQKAMVNVSAAAPVSGLPGFCFGCRFYPLQTGDFYALGILDYLLFKGQSSRIRSRLLAKDMTANSLEGWIDERNNLRALKIVSLSTNGAMADRARRTLLSELDKLKTVPVDESEMVRARNKFKADFLSRMSSRLERSLYLIDLAWQGKAPDSLAAELEQYMKVAPQSILSLANRHFIPANMVILNMEAK